MAFVIYDPSQTKWLEAPTQRSTDERDTWTADVRDARQFDDFNEARDFLMTLPCKYTAHIGYANGRI